MDMGSLNLTVSVPLPVVYVAESNSGRVVSCTLIVRFAAARFVFKMWSSSDTAPASMSSCGAVMDSITPPSRSKSIITTLWSM